MKKMQTQVPSTRNRIILRTGVLLFFILCFACLAQAQWATNGNDTYNTNSGNVGIGTGANTHPEDQLTLDGSAPVLTLRSGGWLKLRPSANDWDMRLGASGSGNSMWMGVFSGGDLSNPRMVITAPGNVGIGTTNPGARLEIAPPSALDQWIRMDSVSAHGNVSANYGLRFQTNGFGDDLGHGYISFETIGNSSPPVERMRLTKDGNVGVGTTNPGQKLQIGDNTASSLGVRIAPIGVNWDLLTDAGGNLNLANGNGSYLTFIKDSITSSFTGNVGIGTTSPTAKLEVKGNAGFRVMRESNPDQTLTLTGGDGSGVATVQAQYQLTLDSHNTSYPMTFQIGGAEKMRVASNGNVGIGTSNPTHKLEVDGTFHANGAITGTTINATYQDVAEWVPSIQKLSACTVVVLDSSKSNYVLASSSSYDTKVAGVISAQPGISLGTSGEDKVLVATTGRVKVKVDATMAPIHVGDLLVTSDNEGVAMKSEPIVISGRKMHAPGTIVGKALEPLEKGTGEILVLLSLQ
jgi:hypothetical protein